MNFYHILFALKQGFNRNLTWYENLFVRFYNNTIAKLVARILRIKGNTVSFNQLNNNLSSSGTDQGVTFTNNQDGSWTLNNTASGTNCFFNINYSNDQTKRLIVIEGHKYYIRGFSADVGFQFTFFNHQADYIRQFGDYIFTSSYTDDTWIRFQIPNGASFNNKKVYPQIHDLTLMGLDTLTLAQVQEWFANYFPLPCYDYQQSLISFNGTGLKTVGFNQWDEQWRNCDINSETGEIISGPYVVAKNFISVLPNTDYYVCVKSYAGSGNVYLYQYSADLTYLGLSKYKNMRPNTIFKTDNKASYILFILGGFYGTTYKNDVCLNISDTSKNGTYEPYTSNTLSLPTQTYFPFGEDGINNVRDELIPNSGVYKRLGKISDLGILNWTALGTSSWLASVSNVKQYTDASVVANFKCSKLGISSQQQPVEKTITGLNWGNQIRLYANNITLSDVHDLVDGAELVYELSTPLHNYGVVDLGTLSWSLLNGTSTRQVFTTYIADLKPSTDNSKAINCVIQDFRPVSQTSTWTKGDISYRTTTDVKQIILCVGASEYVDGNAFAQAMSGKYLLYELETPVPPSSMEDTYPIEWGGTEQILPTNTSTPTTTGILADIHYPDGDRTDQAFVYRVIEKVQSLGNRALSIMLGKSVQTENPEEPLEILLKGEK